MRAAIPSSCSSFPSSSTCDNHRGLPVGRGDLRPGRGVYPVLGGVRHAEEWLKPSMGVDMAAITLANLASFGIGVLVEAYQIWPFSSFLTL